MLLAILIVVVLAILVSKKAKKSDVSAAVPLLIALGVFVLTQLIQLLIPMPNNLAAVAAIGLLINIAGGVIGYFAATAFIKSKSATREEQVEEGASEKQSDTLKDDAVEDKDSEEDSAYAKFMADWTLALKSEDRAKLSALLKTQVPCNFCGATSEAADAYVKGGNFVCPKCGKAWFVTKR